MYTTHIIDPETNEIIPLYNERIYKLLSNGHRLTSFENYAWMKNTTEIIYLHVI